MLLTHSYLLLFCIQISIYLEFKKKLHQNDHYQQLKYVLNSTYLSVYSHIPLHKSFVCLYNISGYHSVNSDADALIEYFLVICF